MSKGKHLTDCPVCGVTFGVSAKHMVRQRARCRPCIRKANGWACRTCGSADPHHPSPCPSGVDNPTPCTDCTSPAEVTDCRADTGDRCGPCHVARCAECQDGLANQDGAEAARDGRWT